MNAARFARTLLGKGEAPLLAIEADDVIVRGVVGRRSPGAGFDVRDSLESRAPDIGAALKEIAAALRAKGAGVPDRAIVLSPHVQTAILRLPVDPRAPLPFAQMQEMVKWELEPYLSRTRARRIGAILVARGYLDAPDLERLLEAMSKRTAGEIAGAQPRRLGEIAIEKGLITKAQLEECLALQGSLQDFEGGAACGWIPLDEPPSGGTWRWLVAGVSEGFRRHLLEAFEGAGIRLEALYPLVGCAGACLNGSAVGGSAVFEYHNGHLGYARYDGRRMLNCRSLFTHEAGNPLQGCRDLFEGDAERIWLAGRWPDPGAAIRGLAAGFRKPCAFLKAGAGDGATGGGEADALLGVRGAAEHYAGKGRRDGAVFVPAREPAPPMARNPLFRYGIAATLLAAAFAAAGACFKARMSADADRIADIRAVAQEERQLSLLLARHREQGDRIRFLREGLPARRVLIPRLLKVLEEARTDEVQVRRIFETDGGGVEVQGWSLTARGIQSFRERLRSRLPGAGIAGAPDPIRPERGWGGIPGFSFSLRLSLPGGGGPEGGAP